MLTQRSITTNAPPSTWCLLKMRPIPLTHQSSLVTQLVFSSHSHCPQTHCFSICSLLPTVHFPLLTALTFCVFTTGCRHRRIFSIFSVSVVKHLQHKLNRTQTGSTFYKVMPTSVMWIRKWWLDYDDDETRAIWLIAIEISGHESSVQVV